MREGVTNVVRHSRAQHVRIVLRADHLEIRDDGRGEAVRAGTGHGLQGLRERCAAHGAELSHDGGGTGFVLRVHAAEVAAPAAVAHSALRP